MPQPLFQAEQHGRLVAGLGVDDAIGMQTGDELRFGDCTALFLEEGQAGPGGPMLAAHSIIRVGVHSRCFWCAFGMCSGLVVWRPRI